MPQTTDLLDAASALLRESGIDVRAWSLGFARALPAVALVPAFGLNAVPAPVRPLLAAALGACIAPALAARVDPSLPFVLALAREVLLGLPVALLAALAIYVAAMAGGLIDELRGARDGSLLPTFPEQLPSLGTLFALLASIAFLESGGAARVARVLAEPELPARFAWVSVAKLFAGSVELALALAAPLVVAAVLLEAASALVARAAVPAFIGPVLAPVKSLALLAILAVTFERIAELLLELTLRMP